MKKHVGLLLVTLLIIGCAGGSKTEKKEITKEEHFQLAFAAAQRGNLDEAVSEYQQVLQLDPKNAVAHLNLGMVYGRQGKPKDEISEYRKALSVDPDFAQAYFHLGLAYYEQGNLDESEKQ